MKKLVIVESPTKAKTIGKYLGDDYIIRFSMGHVMDLPKSTLGVDVSNNFEPELEVVKDKRDIISDLQKISKESELIILATDPDREGEAIASNIKDVLSLKLKNKDLKFQRIVFHEITKDAILEAVKNPREVDKNLVDAQTARRILDRLVGYKISPVLWQKVRRGLSAGRVQSVALRLIVEREKEINKFGKEAYFSIHAKLRRQNEKHEIEFELIEINDERIEISEKFNLYDGDYTVSKTKISSEEKATNILQKLKTGIYKVADVLQKETRRSPAPAYTTSTLQQDASRRFGYPGKRTMSLAQKLYEEGFITYHRTDSVTLSSAAVENIRKYILKTYGEKYVPASPRLYSGKQKLAQEAHEGIRPTNIEKNTEEVRSVLGNDCAKLYELIWRRAVSSQMNDALIESTSVFVDTIHENEKYRFKANGSVLKFDGFLKVNPQALSDNKLPRYEAGEELKCDDLNSISHETPPPPRYNDASVIQTLEERGIGRPSTYASIISVLTERGYVERVERRFVPTPVGIAVNDFLVSNFSTIDDIPFTAQMEYELDEVADGKKQWVEMMNDFYVPFEKSLENVKTAARVKIETEETGETCPQCNEGKVVVRSGKFGKFFSCSSFPSCKFTKPYVEQTDVLCPKDGGKVIIKKTRSGRKFYGCSNYPSCNFAAWKLEDIKKA